MGPIIGVIIGIVLECIIKVIEKNEFLLYRNKINKLKYSFLKAVLFLLCNYIFKRGCT